MRLLEGLALLELDRANEAVQAFGGALTAADALLALADSNVAALQARALTLAGLAAATGDPARTSEAVQAFTHTRTIASAAGELPPVPWTPRLRWPPATGKDVRHATTPPA